MRVAAVVCLLVCTELSSDVAAQPLPGGSIRGSVRDEQQGMLADVRVTAAIADAPTTVSAISAADGSYRLFDLPPGTYTMTAEVDGFARWVREGVVVRTGLNVTIDVTMKVGTLIETVEVRVETPLVESKTAAQAINISGELQRELPLTSRRHWSNFIAIAPGVSTSNQSSQELFHFLHGSSYDSNLTMVDGTDSTRATQTSTLGINYSTETLEDMQVVTGGTDASVPLGTGVVVNAVTRSGTNQVRGSGALAYQPSRWNGVNVPGGTSPATSIVQVDLAAGGPLVRDRAWAFGAFRHNDTKNGLTRTPQQIALLQALVPSFQPFRTATLANYYFVKPTFTIDRHSGSISYRRDISPNDSASATDAAVFTRTRSGGDTVSGRVLSVWRGDLTTTVAVMRTNASGSSLLTRTDVPSRRVHAGTIASGARTLGTGTLATLDNRPNFATVPDWKTTVAGDATWSPNGPWGAHELRGGVYIDRRHSEAEFGYPAGGLSLEELVLRDAANPAAGLLPFHRQLFDRERVTILLIDAINAAAYAQDTWRPSDRVSVTVGLRADAVKQTDQLFDVRLQNSVDLSPSLGLNYALGRSHAAALRASYSRRREVMVLASAGSSAAGFRDQYDANLDGVFETVLVTPGSAARATDRVFDPNRHQPFAEDINVGVRAQLPGRTLVDAGLFQRRFRESLTAVEQNGIYERNVFSGYRNPALNDIYLITNNIWNWPVYRSLELQLSRQTARMQVLASYTRQWQHLAGTWQPNDPASFIQPGAFRNTRGIGLASGSTITTEANSLSGTSMAQSGVGSPWQDHLINAAGSVKLGRGWFASMTYNYTSGAWSGPVVTRRASPDPQFGPATVTLSNGRIVANPLATALRFVGDTRSDGQFTLDARHLIGFGVGQTVRLRALTARGMLQVFNLTNSDAGLFVTPGGNQVFSPNFRQVSSRTSPRAMQVGVRFEF